MNSSKKISIIITTFNRAHVLKESIESVINQSSPQWELIIVDDGSQDKTSLLVEEYITDKRIKYYFQENSGVSSARNKGAKVATGDYLIFLDSDDKFHLNLIQQLYDANFFQYDLICWEVLKVINGKSSIWKPSPLGKLYNGLNASFLAGSICYKKFIFEKAGGYDVKMVYGENYELGIRIGQLKELKTLILFKPFLTYTLNTKTRESNSLSNKLNSHLHQYNKHQVLFEQDPNENAKMNYIIAYVLEMSGNVEGALCWYRCSWKINPWNLKPLLKIIFLNLSK